MAQCLVSFGANLGARETVIAQAARELARRPDVANFRASRLYETPPIGGPSGQEPFLNGVAAFDTTADARQVLAWLQDLETRLGRQRRHRWGARAIDLDVVLHGRLIGGASDLTVPHPRYTARRFVLLPACDVAAEYLDPRFGWTIAQLCRHLESGSPSLALTGCDVATRSELCRLLTERYGLRTFAEPPLPAPMTVRANAPSPVAADFVDTRPAENFLPPSCLFPPEGDAPWVSAFVPPLPPLVLQNENGAKAIERILQAGSSVAFPRLIARVRRTREQERWPAPHQIWPSSGRWPEYRLEFEDLDWAAGEVRSALDSMRCPTLPITPDGCWWV
ncbi:MAG: 2-amino-4-hydroxy-6-hydroxymethyldihydropteridine diphosphokinase [Planctomycetaceae bacterium]|nr:MAG: 2-amino-4-hydroxy-6-hydroxymethyldihydropteridine diphosphokinase [Planctomycetaceae bacterium]